MAAVIGPQRLTEEPHGKTFTEAQAPTPRETVPELSDKSLFRIFVRGALIGTPLTFLVLTIVAVLAVPDPRGAILAAVWPSLWGGWFFGGNVVLAVEERRTHRSARAQRE